MAYKRTTRRSAPGTPTSQYTKPRATGASPNPSARARLRASANARFNRGMTAPNGEARSMVSALLAARKAGRTVPGSTSGTRYSTPRKVSPSVRKAGQRSAARSKYGF